MTSSVKISSTDELLAVLPHQVGHQLAQCVAILMVTDKIIGPVARFDLPPERDVRRVADALLVSLRRIDPQLAMLVGYDSVPGESRSLLRAVHHGLVDAGVGIIDHVVVREGRWWGWCCRPANSLDGLLPDHIDGHPLADEATVPAVAEFIARGSAPLSSREEVGALIEEDPALSAGVGDELAALWDAFCRQIDPDGLLDQEDDDDDDDDCDGACEPGTCSWCDSWDASDEAKHDDVAEHDDDAEHDDEAETARLALLEAVVARIGNPFVHVEREPELWGRLLAPVGDRGDAFAVSDGELARMVRSLDHKPWRDALIAWMSPVMFPLEKVDEHSRSLLEEAVPSGPATTSDASSAVLRRLQLLARRVPDEWSHEAAAICTVTGCVAWGVGSGSAAGDAVTRALRVEPDYRLAMFLGRMIEFQMRPRHPWGGVAA
ncbi:DUF4192 family protein [Knoellia sinensis]|nr:DUF4192 family protein [Knoellia sinensis]